MSTGDHRLLYHVVIVTMTIVIMMTTAAGSPLSKQENGQCLNDVCGRSNEILVPLGNAQLGSLVLY